MIEDDPHADVKAARLTPEILVQLATSPCRPRVSKKPRHFVKVPVLWVERLAGARRITTYRVALHLLYRSWKTGSRTVGLSNAPLAAEGISRRAKWRALWELERLGLVLVERRQRRVPRVTVLSSS